jgi:hypothetical protein
MKEGMRGERAVRQSVEFGVRDRDSKKKIGRNEEIDVNSWWKI